MNLLEKIQELEARIKALEPIQGKGMHIVRSTNGIEYHATAKNSPAEGGGSGYEYIARITGSGSVIGGYRRYVCRISKQKVTDNILSIGSESLTDSYLFIALLSSSQILANNVKIYARHAGGISYYGDVPRWI